SRVCHGCAEAPCNEKCDGSNCPSSCPSIGCQLRTLQGSAGACTAECVSAGTETNCKSGDGSCPPGGNANNDNNCTPVCGNSIVESGETCDPPNPACQTQYDT